MQVFDYAMYLSCMSGPASIFRSLEMMGAIVVGFRFVTTVCVYFDVILMKTFKQHVHFLVA